MSWAGNWFGLWMGGYLGDTDGGEPPAPLGSAWLIHARRRGRR